MLFLKFLEDKGLKDEHLYYIIFVSFQFIFRLSVFLFRQRATPLKDTRDLALAPSSRRLSQRLFLFKLFSNVL